MTQPRSHYDDSIKHNVEKQRVLTEFVNKSRCMTVIQSRPFLLKALSIVAAINEYGYMDAPDVVPAGSTRAVLGGSQTTRVFRENPKFRSQS